MLSYFFTKEKQEEWKEWENEKKPSTCKSMNYYCENFFDIKVDESNPYYDHFGKFSYFLQYHERTLSDLIHFYDSCKGYARYMTWDPNYICLTKNFIKHDNASSLSKIDFEDFFYDYTKIHAYVVAEASLSTLVMRIIAHHLFNMGKLVNYGTKCIILGKYIEPPKTKISPFEFSYCSYCQRICDKLWGSYSLCLDCHHTKICSSCGHEEKMDFPSHCQLPLCMTCTRIW